MRAEGRLRERVAKPSKPRTGRPAVRWPQDADAVSFGATVLGPVRRKKLSTGTIGRATTTMRDVGRSLDEKAGDVKGPTRPSTAAKQKVAALEEQLQMEIAALKARPIPPPRLSRGY